MENTLICNTVTELLNQYMSNKNYIFKLNGDIIEFYFKTNDLDSSHLEKSRYSFNLNTFKFEDILIFGNLTIDLNNDPKLKLLHRKNKLKSI